MQTGREAFEQKELPRALDYYEQAAKLQAQYACIHAMASANDQAEVHENIARVLSGQTPLEPIKIVQHYQVAAKIQMRVGKKEKATELMASATASITGCEIATTNLPNLVTAYRDIASFYADDQNALKAIGLLKECTERLCGYSNKND